MKIEYQVHDLCRVTIGEATTFAEADALIREYLTPEREYLPGPILTGTDWSDYGKDAVSSGPVSKEFGEDSYLVVSDITPEQMEEWLSHDYEE